MFTFREKCKKCPTSSKNQTEHGHDKFTIIIITMIAKMASWSYPSTSSSSYPTRVVITLIWVSLFTSTFFLRGSTCFVLHGNVICANMGRNDYAINKLRFCSGKQENVFSRLGRICRPKLHCCCELFYQPTNLEWKSPLTAYKSSLALSRILEIPFCGQSKAVGFSQNGEHKFYFTRSVHAGSSSKAPN